MTDTKIYCALDTDSLDHALDMAGMMEQASCGLKLGMEFFNAQGPQGIAKSVPRIPMRRFLWI